MLTPVRPGSPTSTSATVARPPSARPGRRATSPEPLEGRVGALRERRLAGRTEALGFAAAVVLALVVVAHAATAQAWLLFEDSDSLVVVLVQRSLAVGQPQDWAMSPVLFLPETGLYLALSSLGLTARATLTLNALVNLVALYAAIRVAAGSRAHHGRPVGAALAAFAAFCALALSDGGSRRAGFQLASLLTTTTYYAATVVGGVVVVGLVRRALDRPERVRALAVLVGALAAASTLTNPLFAGWVTLPAAVCLGVVGAARREAARPTAALAAALLAGTASGYVARTPLARHVVADPENYLRPHRWGASLRYYGDQLAATPGTAAGALSLGITLVGFALCGVVAVLALRRGRTGTAVVGLVGVASPLGTLVGAVATGTQADRYLQPWVFLTVLALAAAPDLSRRRHLAALRPWRRGVRSRPVATGVVLLVAASLATPLAVRAATGTDRDLQCAVDWIDASGRTGAGQFWSVRAAKASVADPRSLVQVDARLGVYDWLTDRDDRTQAVSFLLVDARSVPFELPPGAAGPTRRVTCGRYTILDFAPSTLPLDPAS